MSALSVNALRLTTTLLTADDRAPRGPASAEVRPATILHVEDDRTVSEAVKDTLEAEGWAVETCADGSEALRRLAGDARFDLLIFDHELPGLSGLELVAWARRLPGRRGVPIIMLSASDVGAEARRAGVDAYLRKPEDIGRLAETVSALLSEGRD